MKDTDFLTPSQAGRLFSPPLSPARVRQLVDSGQLHAERTVGGWRLIREADVMKAIQMRARKGVHADV